MTTGERIRHIRNERGISQKQLSEMCGLSEPAIRNYEQLPSVRSLAKDLKISIITTAKAYELLEQDGSVTYIPEHGYIVTSRV